MHNVELSVEEIHRIREENYAHTREMQPHERRAYYRERADAVQKRIDKIKEAKGSGRRTAARI